MLREIKQVQTPVPRILGAGPPPQPIVNYFRVDYHEGLTSQMI